MCFLPDLEWREMAGDDCEFHYGGRNPGAGEREGDSGQTDSSLGFYILDNWEKSLSSSERESEFLI